MVSDFDLNHFVSSDLNQLHASDFDFKMAIVWFVMLVENLTISIFQRWSDVDMWRKRTLWCVFTSAAQASGWKSRKVLKA